MLRLNIQLFADDPEGATEPSLEDVLSAAGGGGDPLESEQEPKDPEPKDPEPKDDPAPEDPKEPEDKGDEPEPKAPKNKPKKNPMKEIRDKLKEEQERNNLMSSTISRFTAGDYEFNIRDFKDEEGNMDYVSLNEAMDAADNEAKAKSKGISPEVQAEIDRIEKEKTELQKEQLKVSMDRSLIDLRVAMGLSDTDVNKFFQKALQQKKNPYKWLAQGGNLTDLYVILNRDSLTKTEIEKAVAEAKVKWEADYKKSQSALEPNPAAPTKPKTPRSDSAVSLDDLLKEAVE